MEKETSSNIIIGVFNVPFSTYTTFDELQLEYQITYSASLTESYTQFSPATSGSGSGSDHQGSIIRQAVGGAGLFSQINFLENVGFSYYYADSNTVINATYYFSDYEDTDGIPRLTTTISTCMECPIRSTIETTKTTTIAGVSTTWTDVTTESQTASIEYTDIFVYETYSNRIAGDLFYSLTYLVSGDGLVIQPHYGTNWTQDGSNLQYLELFTNTGTYKPFDAIIIKDNDEEASTFYPEKTTVSYNLALLNEYGVEITVISSKAETLTYEVTTYEVGTITFSTSYYFFYLTFYTRSDFETERTFLKKAVVTSSLVQVIQTVESFINEDEELRFNSMYSRAYYTDTRPIPVYTTATYYCPDNYLSYFSLLTYSGLIITTSQKDYIVADIGLIGTRILDYTDVFPNGDFAIGATTTLIPKTRCLYKAFSSIELETANSEWNKYYTQYSPNFNFVVGGTSNSVGGYVELTPSSLITKLYFTTHKFERTGAVKAPILAIPINYTSISQTLSTSLYTYQQATCPNEFLIGSSQASVYWTLSTQVGISFTSTTSSFTLSYNGSQSKLTMGYYDVIVDFATANVNQVPYNGNIYYTKGIVNTESGASWLQDGKYYWSGSDRTTSGFVDNIISAIGNGRVSTFVGSYWQENMAFPVLSNLKTHINSYA